MNMSTVTSSNGYHHQQNSNNYWRSTTNLGNSNGTNGSLSSGNHSPSSTSSTSSSLNGSSSSSATTTVHVKNYNGGNGLLLSQNPSRYQSPYFESSNSIQQQQQQQQPSPLPRTITSGNNYGTANGKYINNTSMNLSRGLYSSSYEEQQQKGSFRNQLNGTGNIMRKVNHGSSNEINVTVNNSSSGGPTDRSKYYTNGVASASGGGNGNYYIPGIDKSSTISSSGGVSVQVGRSSSYNHINTIGRTSSYSPQNQQHQNGNNYYNGQNVIVPTHIELTHQAQSQHQQQQRYNPNPNPSNNVQQQRRIMNNVGMSNPNSTTSANVGLNGTVAVAVVTRSQSKQQTNETSSGSNSGYNGTTRIVGGNCSESRNSTGSRQIVVGSSEQNRYNNCNNSHKPAQRVSSYPTGTKIGTTMGDGVDGEVGARFAHNNHLGKKVGINGSMSNSSTSTMSHNNARKKGILRKDGRKKMMNVTFPKEVCEVIGFGGDTSDEESDDEPIPDPQDSSSVAELLDKNASTPNEKELNRLTVKNTNFNSIKTNLLGYTSIEIGPIVGCMNGNSLTGPSKPLISIGTFETRGQPLKIKRVNEEKEQQQQKPIKKDSIVKVNGVTTNSRMNSATSTSKNTNNMNLSMNIKSKLSLLTSTMNSKPLPIPTTPIPAIIKCNPNTTPSANNANANANAVNGNLMGSTAAKTTTTSNFNPALVNNDVTGSVNRTNSCIKINPENTTLKSTSKNTMNEVSENNNAYNGHLNSSAISSNSNNGSSNVAPPIPTNSAPVKASSNYDNLTSLSNLYIPNDGNIASRRSTFLNDILSLDTPITLDVNETDEKDDGGCSIPLSLGQEDSLDPPRVVKLESSPLSNSTVHQSQSAGDSGTHFDDSLEDSGLDIKTAKSMLGQDRSLTETSSESDNEKSGSNSDSGTEHDFMTEINNRNKAMVDENNGLFISVEESCTNTKLASTTAAKLSPDSLLSEMSATTESLNEDSMSAHDVEEGDYEEDESPPLEIVPPPTNPPFQSGPTIPPILKRLAPPPPAIQTKPKFVPEHESIYTNEEELYDDVATLREESAATLSTFTSYNETNLHSNGYNDEYDDANEESLYDDCTTLGHPPSVPTSGKAATTGSYDFTDTNNRSGLDPDFNEKIPLKPDDGIEFIGIRKIDSESFLKQQSPPPLSPTKKDRGVGSGSPKTKRRVNQFFSTIGKRAGAAFSRAPLDFASTKASLSSSPPGYSPAHLFTPFSNFKRSLSQDEVSMTRTQEIYATLSPSMLKNKGLAPVLNKLSKLDLHYSTTAKECKDEDKVSRKNKFSISLKKFLKFGSKDGDNKYEFGQQAQQPSPTGSDKSPPSAKTDFRDFFANGPNPSRRSGSSSNVVGISENQSISSTSPRHSSVSHLEEISSGNTGKYYTGTLSQQSSNNMATNYGLSGPCPTRPPPPPPRVYSADQLNSYKVDQTSLHPSLSYHHQHHHNSGQSGSGSVTPIHSNGNKPARPPPPVIRTNKVAPSFMSVFAGADENSYNNIPPPPLNQRRPSSSGSMMSQNSNSGYEHDTVRGVGMMSNPPNKPKRKASIYRPGESSDQGAYTANYLETTYNHITSLNFETLKLIASQTPATIRRGSTPMQKFNKASPLRWSQFFVTDVEPLTHGKGFCFYSAFWEDEQCILLVQESLSCGTAPLEFDCIESMASFEDIIPSQVITWKPSEYVNTGSGVKVFVSVLPSCTVQTLPNYLNNTSISPSRKYFALLQAMDFWGRDDLSDLVVFHQIPSECDSPISDYSSGSLASKTSKYSSQSPNFGLVYVASARLKSGGLLLSSQQCSRVNFELAMTKLIFSNNSYHQLLCDNDENILYRRISSGPGLGPQEVEAQLKLFLQLKLFGAQGNDLDKIIRYRSEKQVTQWMDKERAFCMKDAIERTLQRNSEPISPLRKSFVEFLMISDGCAKAVLDLIVDLNPDV